MPTSRFSSYFCIHIIINNKKSTPQFSHAQDIPSHKSSVGHRLTSLRRGNAPHRASVCLRRGSGSRTVLPHWTFQLQHTQLPCRHVHISWNSGLCQGGKAQKRVLKYRKLMEDYNDLTYDMLPQSWAFCFINGCKNEAECIRHISSCVIPSEATVGRAIYPTAVNTDPCPHFKPIRKIRAAWGFDTLFSEVKMKDSTPLRGAIKKYLGGHGTYYRYHNGERLLTPEQQQAILNLFKNRGYTTGLEFDHYCNVYDIE